MRRGAEGPEGRGAVAARGVGSMTTPRIGRSSLSTCAGCPLLESGVAAYSSGRMSTARDMIARAVEATPTLAPAWRALAWIETINPNNDDDGLPTATLTFEAGRTTVAAVSTLNRVVASTRLCAQREGGVVMCLPIELTSTFQGVGPFQNFVVLPTGYYKAKTENKTSRKMGKQ